MLASDYGLPGVFNGWTNTEATAISPDGFAIAGHGTNSSGKVEAWMVRLPRKSFFSLSQTSVSFSESAGVVEFIITKTTGVRDAVSYAIIGESAIPVVNGVGDFTGLSGQFTFDTYETSKTISLAINNDAAPEGAETLRVTLTGAAGGSRILNAITSVTILDDDTGVPVPAVRSPDAAPSSQGALLVNLTPPEGRWRLAGETEWRASGEAVVGLTVGDYVIEFEPLAGGPVPAPFSVPITGGGTLTLPVEYPPADGAATGTVQVLIQPPEVASAGSVALQGQWRFLGETLDTDWRNHNATVTKPAGAYVIEFKSVPNRAPVPNRSIFIPAGDGVIVSAFYEQPIQPLGTVPARLTLAEATGEEPFAFVGQVRTDLGTGSGTAVMQKVVLTAGHVVFDDLALKFAAGPINDEDLGDFTAGGIEWRFQRMRGEFEPIPVIPRGAYVLSGYASARQGVDPGESNAISREQDVAALFFVTVAGRSGFSGWLRSAVGAVEWPQAPRLKTLVGYPVDSAQVEPGDVGKMHATTRALAAFQKPNANVPGTSTPSYVYSTQEIAGFAGMSGGPLCVQWDDGRYYPAAVFLGGTQQSFVRGIDERVEDLINRARISGDDPAQNLVGGGIVRVESKKSGGQFQVGSLQVNIEPSSVRAAGAGWKFAFEGGSFRPSGAKASSIPAGRYFIVFKDIAGFKKPDPLEVSIQGDEMRVVTYVVPPTITTSTRFLRAIRNRPLPPFAIEAAGDSPRFMATGLAGTGLTLNENTGVLSGTPRTNGKYVISITAQNSAGTSAPLELTIIVTPPGKLIVQADATRGSVTVKPHRADNVFPQGKKVTLTAKPDRPEFLFAGWNLEGGKNASNLDSPTLSFRMTEIVTATAAFVPSPFLTRSGSYRGLLSGTEAPAGLTTLSLTRTGGFTLQVKLGDRLYSLKGHFDLEGNFIGRIRNVGRHCVRREFAP